MQVYTVVAGDTLESIAKRFDSDPDLIAAASGVRDVQPGEMITIP